MTTSALAPEEWVACAPMFAASVDGFGLTDAARALLEHAPAPSSSDLVAPSVFDRVAAVHAELRALAAELPAAARVMPAHDLLDTLEALQTATNMLGSCDQAVVAEIDRHGVHETAGATSTAQLLRTQLRIRPAEAKRRVAAARACGVRVAMTGEVLPPLREQLSAAQAAGEVTSDHAAVIAGVLDRLPTDVAVDELDLLEQALLGYARTADPTAVAVLGRHVIDLYDPDGPKPRDTAHRRRRALRLTARDSGMGNLAGDLTADLLAKLQAVLSPLAAPRPADANGADDRTPEMRLHDALEEVCDRLLRSGTLPDAGGVPATVSVTIPLAELERRAGRAHTSHGGTLSVGQLLQTCCETEIIPVVLGDAGGILAYGRSKRLATPAQTKALHARDKGCCFPGCDRPPEWTQRHHVTPWLHGGTTDIDHLALLCTRHHHSFESWGWTLHMVDGVPWWTPPAHLDPDQKPVRNHAHDRPTLADLTDTS